MEKRFDKALHDKLSGYRMEPPEGLWDAIERDMQNAQRTPTTLSRRRIWSTTAGWVAAACILVAAAITGTIYMNRQAAIQLPQVQTASYGEKDAYTEPVTAKENIAASKTAPKIYAAAVIRTAAGQTAQTMQTKENHTVTPQTTVSDNTSRDTDSEAQQKKPASQETAKSGKEPDKGAPQYASETGNAQARSYARTGEAAKYYNPIRGKQRGRGISTSLYAANFGGGRKTDSGGNIMSSGGYLLSETVTRTDSRESYFAVNTPEITSVNHRIPLSAGLEASFGIAPRLSIESGLSYSFLRSDFQAEGYMSDYSIKQELHYVGIPVSVTYRFAQTASLDFYIRGGGMLEKGVYGKRETKVSAQSQAEKSDVKMEGVQPSLAAAAGIELKMSRLMGLYFEPGMSYYPTRDNQPESYRTENPITLNLKAGLRLNIGRK